VLCPIELDDKYKIGQNAQKQLEDLQLLYACYKNNSEQVSSLLAKYVYINYQTYVLFLKREWNVVGF
jgi:hypothetical protein